MKSWRLFLLQRNCQIKRLTFRDFSFELHPSTVCDSQRRQKAEVNGFAAYRGKAHLKDSIREGMVGHKTVVLSSETSEHVTVNLFVFKE